MSDTKRPFELRKNVNVYPQHHDLLVRVAEHERRTITATFELLIEQEAKRLGIIPQDWRPDTP